MDRDCVCESYRPGTPGPLSPKPASQALSLSSQLPRAGGAAGNPIIPGSSPRRRRPLPASAAGFGFLASNQGITDNPGTTGACTAGHLHDLTTHITRTGGKAIAAGQGLLAAGRAGQVGGRAGSLSILPSPLCHIPQAHQVSLGTATSALEATPGTMQEPGTVGCA